MGLAVWRQFRGSLVLVFAISCTWLTGCRHQIVNGSFPSEIPLAPVDREEPINFSNSSLVLDSLESSNLQNLLHISDRIFSGGEPAGDLAFQELSRLGVRTLISVDGARPDIDRARKYGLRYVHVPIGYDGIDARSAYSLVRAVRETSGKVYLHCHHGRHRGPAAAAIACVAEGRIDPGDGWRILEHAGTSRDYVGLWRDVEAFQLPEADVVLPELVEVAPVGDLAESMAKMDRVFDRLALMEKHQWKAPESHPDLSARQEALLLGEFLHESGRLMGDGASEDLLKSFEQAEGEVIALREALNAMRLDQATALLKQVKTSCKTCHQSHRNRTE